MLTTKGAIMRNKSLNLSHSALKEETVMRLLKGITAAVPIQYIYLHTSFFAGKAVQEMLIMVSFKHVRILNELTPVLNIVFNGQMEFTYRVFHVHEVEQTLLAGSLFFYYATAAQNCLFSKSGSFLDCGAPRLIADRVSSTYQCETSKANKFLSGANFYFKQRNFEYCTFMLHQVFDLMYRAIEVLVMGKDKKTHRIKTHQQYIKAYVKQLSELFNHDEEELCLLHLLDEAYLAVRYENNYEIGEPDVIRMLEKVDLLYIVAEQVYQGIMNNHFDQQVAEMRIG
ncbi:HEPN domain-containing protein [Pedobacter psychrodurus]|uniref:HEPN domain-containing protein n=1 Tax=Pedobacter psychrodurus TaxID=2530456 RepID=A0A4V2MQP3_9SPHI|nr:HEPN domain-containing protein [Pedobacter psychrodurus]TCD25438.1 HEPN domain-containing protein [Pedobacter psychrodurus]